MDRKEYLNQLSKHLSRLPKKDYDDAMNHFEEYFDEADSEEDLIKELGNPRDVAAEILSKLLSGEDINRDGSIKDKKTPKNVKSKNIYRSLLIAILVVLAAPIGLPLTIALIAIIFSIVIVIASLIFSAFAVVLAGIVVFIKLIVVGLISTFISAPGGLILIGSSLVVLCITLFLVIFIVFLYRLLMSGLKKIVSVASRKKR